MDRLRVIQTLMQQKKLKNYLEIGVFNGHIFFRVKARFKVAVDPEFRFDTTRKIGKAILNPFNLYNRYFQKTSDDFFSQDASRLFTGNKVDIALIDGMHEYAFALRDVENTLRFLSDDGVIVMHDCNPQSRQEACSFEAWKANGYAGTWNGDVWKAIVHLRSLRNDIDVFVLDCDHGLGIICKRKPGNSLPFSPQAINDFTYDDLDLHRNEWLSLQPVDYFYDYFTLL